MRRANVISGLGLTAISLFMLFVIIPWQVDPAPAGMMSTRLVPNMMMIAVAALSVILVLTNLGSGAAPDAPPPFTRADLLSLLKVIGLFALSIGLYLLTGPLPAGLALVFGGLVAFGERRPLLLILIPALLLVALWLLFYKVLGTAIV